TDHIGVAGNVHGDARAIGVAYREEGTAQARGIEQRRACGVQLGYKGVVGTTAVVWLKGSGRGREIVRLETLKRHTGHVRVAVSVQRNAVRTVDIAATEIRGIDERGTLRIQLGHEAVQRAPSQRRRTAESRLEASGRGRKI